MKLIAQELKELEELTKQFREGNITPAEINAKIAYYKKTGEQSKKALKLIADELKALDKKPGLNK